MDRKICICLDFLNDVQKQQIDSHARSLGFASFFFNSTQLDDAKRCLQDCEVLYANSVDLVRAAPSSLKWYCCAAAGIDVYCKAPDLFANPDCLMTNSRGYGVTIAEHVIMFALMLLRRMPEYERIVDRHAWINQLPIQSIQGNSFTILGTGNLGSSIAERLRGMKAARIIGVNRSGRSQDPVFDEVVPISQLDTLLANTGFLIMALPGTPETEGILTRERIHMLPQSAYLINVGRGTAVDQDALIEALEQGRIAGAALDVMTPEPLPEDHHLWNARNLILTPHASGNLTLGYTCELNVEMFCEDLSNYVAGRPLKNLVDRKRGY